jgi:hypothetical protein
VRDIDGGVDVPGLVGFFNGVARKVDSEHRAAYLPGDPTTVVVLSAVDLEAAFATGALDPFAGDAPDLTLPPGADLDREEVERLVREALQQAESRAEGAPAAEPSE